MAPYLTRSKSLVLIGGIVFGTAAIVAILLGLAPEPEGRDLPPQIPFAQTDSVIARSGAIPVYGSGTVRPRAEINVTPQVGGQVIWVNPSFQSGGRVETGQTLFRIDETDYLFRVQEAEADLAARRVAYLEEQERSRIALDQYRLYSERRGGDGTSTDPSPLTLREPQLEAAHAALTRDEARLADANLVLSRTEFKAPFTGFVRDESVAVGQIISPGEPVGRLFAADAIEVNVSLSHADAVLVPGLWELNGGGGKPRVGARVIARYGATSYSWEGYVDRGEVSLDEQTRTVDVVVRVPDPFSAGKVVEGPDPASGTPPLFVGEFVDVVIEGVSPDRYFRAPRAALQPGNEVWAVTDGGVVSIISVHVLQRADDEVFLTGALRDGLTVITGGLQFATEGMRVQTGTDPVR